MSEAVDSSKNDHIDATGMPDEVQRTSLREVLDKATQDFRIEFIGQMTMSHFWCQYCGGWHGAGNPPGEISGRPAPEIPEVLRMVVEQTVEIERSRWEYGGSVNGQPAKVRFDGGGVEAFWGGYPRGDSDPLPDGPKHGHLISYDGLNANLVAEPGEYKQSRDTPVDDARVEPYDQNSPRYHYNQNTGGYSFS